MYLKCSVASVPPAADRLRRRPLPLSEETSSYRDVCRASRTCVCVCCVWYCNGFRDDMRTHNRLRTNMQTNTQTHKNARACGSCHISITTVENKVYSCAQEAVCWLRSGGSWKRSSLRDPQLLLHGGRRQPRSSV
jgi:hypothetical protein